MRIAVTGLTLLAQGFAAFRVELKKRRANAELEASMARRLEKSSQPRDRRGRYMRIGGDATCGSKQTI